MAVEEKASHPVPEVQPVELAELEPSRRGKPLVMRSLGLIRDVEVKASVVLGEATLSVQRLFDLKEGDVLELDQAIDAPVELLIEGNRVARGRIVIAGENFGILITGISGT